MEWSRRAIPFFEDLALRGVAAQSSQWYNDEARFAIDGNRDSNLYHDSCSHTDQQTNPWWRVDLLDVYSVTSVAVTNRGDAVPERLDGAEIHIGNSLENNGINNPICALISDIPAGATYHFLCNGMDGRYVVVVIPGQDTWLTLCEVEVYGLPVKKLQVLNVGLIPNDQNMDMADLEIKKTILQQINTELMSSGMPDDVKLKWKVQPDGNIFMRKRSEMRKIGCLTP